MISVIVPVYNVEPYLNKCLKSILHQSYQDLEVILVDDGSMDHSSAICDTYAKTDRRVKVIHQENGGLSLARNVGIEHATGEYIAFVDSDDYLLPSMYESMLSALKASEAELVMCNYIKISEDDRYLGVANINQWTGSGEEFLKTDGIVYNYAWNKLYRRELFSDIRFPIGKYFEDISVMHHIFWKAKTVSVIPDILYVYRQREGSISKNLISYHRIDYVEALVKRVRFLLQMNAGEGAIIYYIMQIYGAWNRFYQANMLNDTRINECWRKNYTEICLLTKGISHGWTIRNKQKLFLLRIHPKLFHFQHKVFRLIKGRVAHIKKSFRRLFKAIKINRYFDGVKETGDIYWQKVNRIECLKYKAALDNDGQNLLLRRAEAFGRDDIVLIKDQLSLSDNPYDPIVLVVVKNELERMKVFYDHYRSLGVHQFVVLDNNSDDGTLEFLIRQPDTRVYQTCISYQTQRKEGWIERLLAMTGYNRWYIVVDSDELLDYIGSEKHSAESLIRKVNASGIKRVNGYLLDMYAKAPLFSKGCDMECINEHYRYFDRDGYYIKGDTGRSSSYITGGPRMRVFGSALALGKQAIFYFDNQTMYRDSHSLSPVIPISEMPTLFVLRHYKFLAKDQAEYQRRIREKIFFNDSAEYQVIMEQLNETREISMYYHDSCEYVGSESLKCLPYLEEMKWETYSS